MPWTGVPWRLSSAGAYPRCSTASPPMVAQRGTARQAACLSTCPMARNLSLSLPGAQARTRAAWRVLHLRDTGHGPAGAAGPHIGQHQGAMGGVQCRGWSTVLSRVTCANGTASARAPSRAGQSPLHSPLPPPRLPPWLGASALAPLPARCLEAIQAPCLVSMATPVEITLKRNETSSFPGWHVGGGELGWERLGGGGAGGRGGSWVGRGCRAAEVPYGAGLGACVSPRPPSGNQLLAIPGLPTGHKVLAHVRAVLGAQHPDLVG